MLQQEYPTQIQPRSSSTRETQDVIELQQDSSNKVDAEASRILIDLANQDTSSSSLEYFKGSSNNLMMIDNKFNNNKRRASSKVSLPIKTDANIHLQQERSQPDPIMLLAAAAAVIDDEGKYKKRSYERREIRLHGRQASATKRKSFTYGSNYNNDDNTSSNTMLHRRHSERRHRYHYNQSRPSVSMATDTWSSTIYQSNKEEEEVVVKDIRGNESRQEQTENGGSTQHAFSWQYLSMKQNPRIKRNAMHAYITYMIYTDMAHERQGAPPHHQQQQQQQQRPPSSSSSHYHHNNTRYNTKEEEESSNSKEVYNNWYPKQQSYRLPPSPRQRHDPPTTESIIGRPLTDFLFEKSNNRLPSLFD